MDSEARIFPVKDGRYIVSAQDELSLFSEGGELLRKYKLPAGVPSSVTVAPHRTHVVLRSHGTESQVVYQWLSSDTLQVEKQLSHAEPGSALAFSVTEDGLVFRRRDGLHYVSMDGTDRCFCSDVACQNATPLATYSKGPATVERVAFLTDYGAGVVELSGRLLWSKAVFQDLRGNQLAFQGITASTDGRRVAFDVLRGGRGHEDFDGVHLDTDQEIFVFDSSTGRRVLVAPLNPVSGEHNYELSPDGRTLWIFDGKVLRGFDVLD